MNQKTIQNIFLYAALVLYFIYGITSIGMTGLLFSAAIGLIGFSFHLDSDLVAAAIIISGILWKLTLGQRREGFTDSGVPVLAGQNPVSITENVKKFQRKAEPQATLSSQFAEGFADANTDENTENKGGAVTIKKTNEAVAPSSTPAPVNAPTTTPQLAAAVPDASKKAESSGFEDTIGGGMFKLGSVPPDAVGGSHIDVGTTLMNALNALKPDQIKTMTEDTRKLMETQKGLMGMLSSIKPMLQDGKEIMTTFNDMFGKGGMAPMGAMASPAPSS